MNQVENQPKKLLAGTGITLVLILLFERLESGARKTGQLVMSFLCKHKALSSRLRTQVTYLAWWCACMSLSAGRQRQEDPWA